MMPGSRSGAQDEKMMNDTQQWINDVTDPEYVDRLKAALRQKGMSQSEFARICGCSPSRISALVNKKYFGYTPKYIWEKAKTRLNM